MRWCWESCNSRCASASQGLNGLESEYNVVAHLICNWYGLNLRLQSAASPQLFVRWPSNFLVMSPKKSRGPVRQIYGAQRCRNRSERPTSRCLKSSPIYGTHTITWYSHLRTLTCSVVRTVRPSGIFTAICRDRSYIRIGHQQADQRPQATDSRSTGQINLYMELVLLV